MKKTLALVLALVLCLAMTISATAETATGLKFGIAVNTTIDNSKDAEDANGLAQVDSVAVAVLIDADGKIIDVDIDEAQTKMPFTTTGTLGEDFPAATTTKRALGADYGMAAVSKIGEWDAQIAAFCDFVIGKTLDEVKSIGMDETTKPTDVELTAGCTMSIGGFVSTLVAAMENATDTAAAATDKVGVGIVTSTSKSKDAMDGKDGLCQAYSHYAAVAANADGVVTDCKIDSTQGNVNFDATGKLTSDVEARITTKQELGEDYGMRGASAIGKEWFEQANSLAEYAVGKTAADLEGVALDDSNKTTDEELSASVTVSIDADLGAIVSALSYAK
ncbi:MAG: hypothetical protein PHI98_10520 [Eubacteriales bacterium]|nr:hypothetical protein [Eubacteriales bacterium]